MAMTWSGSTGCQRHLRMGCQRYLRLPKRERDAPQLRCCIGTLSSAPTLLSSSQVAHVPLRQCGLALVLFGSLWLVGESAFEPPINTNTQALPINNTRAPLPSAPQTTQQMRLQAAPSGCTRRASPFTLNSHTPRRMPFCTSLSLTHTHTSFTYLPCAHSYTHTYICPLAH